MKCLVIEDDLPLSRVVSRILSRLGHDVDTVDTVASAQSALNDAAYNTILCDYALPDGTALELFDAVQCLNPVPRILVMTGSSAFPTGAAAVRAMGVDGVLLKPFDRHSLADAIGRPATAA